MDDETINAQVRARVLDLLERLHSTCVEGARAFGGAARDAEHDKHRQLLLGYAAQRMEFAGAIAGVMAGMGAVVDPAGAPIDAIHRGSTGIARATTGRDQALFETCRRSETATMQIYAAAISSIVMPLMPPAVAATVSWQFDEITTARAHMQRLVGRG